jgi:tRNA threonylcarbamoyladenosine modification (KEOPS) complex  Pcc1 subunit
VQVCSRALKLVPAAAEARAARESALCLLRVAMHALEMLRKVRACLAFKPLDLERMQYTLAVKASDWAQVRARAESPGARERARDRSERAIGVARASARGHVLARGGRRR